MVIFENVLLHFMVHDPAIQGDKVKLQSVLWIDCNSYILENTPFIDVVYPLTILGLFFHINDEYTKKNYGTHDGDVPPTNVPF